MSRVLDPLRFVLISLAGWMNQGQPRSPNLNAHAERFVRSIKESYLERMILFGEASVRKATAEFVAHYHLERNHQGLGNRLISPESLPGLSQGDVARHERLGGLLNYYYRRAA